jgi:Transcriptional regulator, AbiEi antitoxin/Protein of unknown function (DUF559)
MALRNGDVRADAVLAELAAAQHGVVTRRQLLAAGLSVDQVRLRLERERLLRLYRGVYAPGHVHLTRSGRLLAAAWSAGPEGLLCDVAAAGVHDLRANSATSLDVLLPRRRPWTPEPGIRAHITTTLRPQDRATVDGIPVTSVARTAVDLAARHPARLVERVLDEMVALGVYDQRALDEQLSRSHVRGARQLRAILAGRAAGTTITKSDLEELLLLVCDEHDLPRPRCNAWLIGLEVDAHWPRTRVVIELDSARFHASRTAFERDREKGNLLAAAGYTLLRITWRQLTDAPAVVAEQLRRLLA